VISPHESQNPPLLTTSQPLGSEMHFDLTFQGSSGRFALKSIPAEEVII
jgi:hypothetical protein